MKFETGLGALTLVEIVRGANTLLPFIPEKWKYWVYAVTAVLGVAIQTIAHLSNPDGTEASFPMGLTPEQLEQFKRMFTKEKK